MQEESNEFQHPMIKMLNKIEEKTQLIIRQRHNTQRTADKYRKLLELYKLVVNDRKIELQKRIDKIRKQEIKLQEILKEYDSLVPIEEKVKIANPVV